MKAQVGNKITQGELATLNRLLKTPEIKKSLENEDRIVIQYLPAGNVFKVITSTKAYLSKIDEKEEYTEV